MCRVDLLHRTLCAMSRGQLLSALNARYSALTATSSRKPCATSRAVPHSELRSPVCLHSMLNARYSTPTATPNRVLHLAGAPLRVAVSRLSALNAQRSLLNANSHPKPCATSRGVPHSELRSPVCLHSMLNARYSTPTATPSPKPCATSRGVPHSELAVSRLSALNAQRSLLNANSHPKPCATSRGVPHSSSCGLRSPVCLLIANSDF